MPRIGPWVGVGSDHGDDIEVGVGTNTADSGGSNPPPVDPNDGILRLVWDDRSELKWDDDTVLDWTE